MRKDQIIQCIKDEMDYFLDDSYWDLDDIYDDISHIHYEYLPKEKQTYKTYILKNRIIERLEYGMLIDMMSIYPKEKLRNLKIDSILENK